MATHCDKLIFTAAAIALVSLVTSFASAAAEVSEETLQSISTPDTVETRIGMLHFRNGAPDAATIDAVCECEASLR